MSKITKLSFWTAGPEFTRLLRDFINWQRHNQLLKDPLTIDYELAETFLEDPKQVNLLSIYSVIIWIALKDDIKPEDDTEVLVRLKDGKIITALFSSEDYRFYNSLNEQDITELMTDYAIMPE